MLRVSLVLFGLAMLLGLLLAALKLRPAAAVPPWPARLAHGVSGAAGLAALLLTLHQPERGQAEGGGMFRLDAVVLLSAALLLGLGILLMVRVAPKPVGAVIALHATIAIVGLSVLAAYASFG